MTPEQQKEELSKAYLHAVAAKCGYAVAHWSQDQGCIDTTLAAVGTVGSGTVEDPKLDVQLKATSQQDLMHHDGIHLQLDKRHYDRLRTPNRASPIVLVVLLLPELDADWMTHNPDSLVLKRCAYWESLRGLPAITTDSKVVVVPRTNVLAPAQLQTLMTGISEGTWP